MSRKAFLDQEPPPGYIPGIGRGAVGFVTSVDTFNKGLAVTQAEEDEEEVYDSNGANEEGILATTRQDADDEEADRIYEQIDQRLQSKQKQEITTVEKDNKVNFTDLKRDLARVSEEQWELLPEAGDITRRNKRLRILEQQQQRTYAVPDIIIAGATGAKTNFKSISESRDKLLGSSLDSLLPTTKVDFELENQILNMSGAEQDVKIADINKGRIILTSLRKTEPFKASSWISSARLEEQANNLNQAKSFIKEGCRKVPSNEDIWLENIRLHQSDIKSCKIIIADALGHNRKSEKLWLKAVELENDRNSQKRVIMKALQELPNNPTLWKQIIELEQDSNAVTKLLSKAVELCPQEWDLWTGLVNVSSYQDAKVYLNKARKAIAGDLRVWIAACKLEERENPDIPQQKLVKLISKAISESKQDKEVWFKHAEDSETEGFAGTCKAIIHGYLDSVKHSDFKQLLNDANTMFNSGSTITGNSILQFIINVHPNDIDCWTMLFASVKQSGENLDTLFKFYDRAIELNPKVVLFYLMYAKDLWKLAGDINRARKILVKAQTSLNDQSINLAILKLEMQTGNFDKAESFATDLIEKNPIASDKYWYKYIHILRCLHRDTALQFSNKAKNIFPTSWKLWIQNIQILLYDSNNPKVAREVASQAVKQCANSIPVWKMLSLIDEKYLNVTIRARSDLDMAILQNPKSDELLVAKVQFEIRQQDMIAARQLANKALKLFPNSPSVWMVYLSLIPKMSHRKTSFLDAMKKTENSPIILLGVGVFFWVDGNHQKAKAWFDRALKADRKNGDIWGWSYNYLQKYGSEDEVNKFLSQFEESYDDINTGDRFCSIKKDIKNFDKKPAEILKFVSLCLLNKGVGLQTI
ncbi:Pre-mRNA splicing factor prp1 [Spathaspora passalidarum NRRL Y-27907]|uniref:Pre-mRNA splicing factor prp1 n=1 Tax=Spathaspora passalidarum (strain NRRL Y-27907 / 11-Y1) TaxID=619300 RepID=G3ANY5_SPAPN|nr:Pre-mRNA splicing factor prp1 [Spathaspora passalidarum NRRL Y-27907]EGW32610.1 Pre-mRNA splicing factor prp1 [Spathaspora passalidarum NRRL Y-27907]